MTLALVTAASQALLFRTEVGQVALVDQWERTLIAVGRPVDDARYADLQALSRNGPLYGVATALASGPVLTGALAAVIALVFRPSDGRNVLQIMRSVASCGGASGPARAPDTSSTQSDRDARAAMRAACSRTRSSSLPGMGSSPGLMKRSRSSPYCFSYNLR